MGSDEWWRRAVIYQIYPRSFADGSGDGVGDLAGIRSKVGHLERLGVDAVWLSPFYPSPMDDNGYDISDYCGVDPLFGDLGDFDALVETLHDRGIKVVVDLVVNHSSDEHPWFQDSRAGGSKRDWYIWRPEPTNWGSFFGGSAWQYDPQRGEYYLHLFSPKQPDLNWDNPEVRHAVHDVMRWWLARGVDGFRMDVINLVSKDPAFPDGEVFPGTEYGWFGSAVVDGPRIHEYLAELRREVLGDRRDVLLLGETPISALADARRYTDPANRELDMVISFDHVLLDRGASPWEVSQVPPARLRDVLVRWQRELAPGWNCLYWCNHDQPRVVSRFGDDREHRTRSARTLATVLHLLSGTPLVYQGEELGMANYPFASVEELQDIETLNAYREAMARGLDADAVLAGLRAVSRDNARTPMQWDASPNAGFTTGRPWLPANPDHVEVNAASQYDDPASVFARYRELIRLRHDDPTVVEGSFELLAPDHDQVFAFVRRHEHEELVIAANLSGDDIALPPDVAARVAGAHLLLREPGAADGVLRAWEAQVYRTTA